ncbi:hypothetical protein DSUL_30035 [Desulfovibrionales bacterium]
MEVSIYILYCVVAINLDCFFVLYGLDYDLQILANRSVRKLTCFGGAKNLRLNCSFFCKFFEIILAIGKITIDYTKKRMLAVACSTAKPP